MTLGGLAVAIGELVDDAVVDVENVYRRLGENRRAATAQAGAQVVFDASSEIRNPIILGTVIVNLVFLPRSSCRASKVGCSPRSPRRTS
jgi:Cu/Ag efflux pump CusA